MKAAYVLSMIVLLMQEPQIPAGLEATPKFRAGFGCGCHDDTADYPKLPDPMESGVRRLGTVRAKTALKAGQFIVDELKGDIEMDSGTLYIRGDGAGKIQVKKTGTVFVRGSFKGTIRIECPSSVIIGGSFDGDITMDHNLIGDVHLGCHVIVGWCPGGTAPKKSTDEEPIYLKDVPRQKGITARGTIKDAQVTVLGELVGTIDYGGTVHVDRVALGTAKILTGGHVCMQRFNWIDAPVLMRNVLSGSSEGTATPNLMQITFENSDIPVGCYLVTDPKLHPTWNGKEIPRVELWVKAFQAPPPVSGQIPMGK